MTVTFTVVGDPAPKGSKTAFIRNGRAVLVDGGPSNGARKRYKAWKVAVFAAAASAMRAQFVAGENDGPMDGAVAVNASFFLRPPKHETRAQRALMFCSKQPDVDKLLRAILDPLTELVFTDDARIAYVILEKRYARGREPGVDITITQLSEGE